MAPPESVGEGATVCGVTIPHTEAGLFPWQKRFLRGVARPNVTTCALSVSRSNGKTYLVSRLAVRHLLHGAEHSECILVASSYNQAKLAFHFATRYLAEMGIDPAADRKRWHFRDSANVALVRDRTTGRAIRALGCDPKRMHGRPIAVGLLDEPSQWPAGQRDAMRAAVTSGAGKVLGSKIVALGTRPADPDHWFDRWLTQDGLCDYVQLHAARPDDPPFHKRTIKRANPSYDYLVALRRDLHRQRDLAKRDESVLHEYRALHLNLGESEVGEDVLMDARTWRDAEGDAARDGRYVLGVDLATTGMAGMAAYWPDSGRLEAFGAIPARPGVAAYARRYHVGDTYAVAHRRNELIEVGDRTVDVVEVLRVAWERWGVPRVIVCDTWRRNPLLEALLQASLNPDALVVRRMGPHDGGDDLAGFVRAVLEGAVTPVPNLLLRHSLAQVRTKRDSAGNRWPDRVRGRDDVAMACLLAVALGGRMRAAGANEDEGDWVVGVAG